MGKCGEYNKDMLKVDSCNCDDECKVIKLNGKKYKRNTTYYDINKRCHDCNIVNKKGNLHHYGCDMERCPSCKGQLISCNCVRN